MSFATGLQSLSPFGPIFVKELRTTARRKRTYFLRAIYMLLLLLVLLWAFMVTSSESQYGGGGVAAQNQARAQLGEVFFACFAIFSVFIMGLLGPVLTATSISSERLHKTLPVLLMTPITSWQIVAGKLFSRLLVSLTLIGLGLPVLALVRLLGGVELGQVIGVIVLALLAAVSSAAIGLFFSTLLNRAYAVILLSFATMLILYVFVPFVIAMSWRLLTNRPPRIGAMELICAINPYFMVLPAAIPDVWGRMSGQLPWGWCVGSHLALSAGLMMWSALILRRRARREGQPSGGTGHVNAGVPLAIQTAAPLPDPSESTAGPFSSSRAVAPLPCAAPRPDVKPARPERSVADNPILWHEIRRPLMARRWQRITGVCICLFLLLTVYALFGATHELGDSDGQSAWACVFNFLIAGIALVIASTAISQEKESDTWTLLLATPLSGPTIVWGKAMGIARRLFWPMVFVSLHFLLFAVCRVISFSAAFMAIWIIISFNSIWIATGVYFSLRFSKTTFAVIANLMLAIAAYLLVWAALGLATDIDYVRNINSPPSIDPKWTNLGATLLFCIALAWLLFSLFQSAWKSRGALGQVIVAFLVFITALGIFAAQMDWVSTGRLYETVGWYNPYYFLAQIGRHGTDNLGFYLPPVHFPVPENSSMTCFVVFLIGVFHLALAAFVLTMTSWKFNGLVGRALQARRMAAADLQPFPVRGPITPRLA